MIPRDTRMVFRITLKRAAAYGAVLFLAGALSAAAQNSADIGSQSSVASSQPGMMAQPGAAPSSSAGMAHQGGDDATLEISPQPGIRPPNGASDEIPSNREFRPGEDTASVNRDFRPHEQDLDRGRIGNGKSCLGITVNYTSYCFKGAEEHGLEVTSIDRNSPAEQAGLKATGNEGGVLAAAETASALLGPLQLLTNHFVEKAAQGNRGDLIVAVDDQRVRSQADFNDAMAKARPGDTLYLTVIRPVSGGQNSDPNGMNMDHKTMRIAVKVGRWQPGSADSCADSTTASSQSAPPY
jgi:hypothetical protein